MGERASLCDFWVGITEAAIIADEDNPNGRIQAIKALRDAWPSLSLKLAMMLIDGARARRLRWTGMPPLV